MIPEDREAAHAVWRDYTNGIMYWVVGIANELRPKSPTMWWHCRAQYARAR